ncbi:vacuolar H-ATPase assembly protein Vma21 [Schizosaccharomyces octosporus yFS286]|uniref:Vacuolar H-ATPase assembly protein Vma21 n=1 Tax=Schizosaccharomyces octosporus (strain yFS286) TaxID=483514 RepID=S9RCC4_SCHOY|nr:vacuolar H-ATPase assembly protein Vma21 [Schizosaccharomyces octosporus yFS286]EPX71774.1 vacuolar H-ATPase assembly protein Vma21 [Schizosaccharomyces octosporus yFS286]
MPAKIVEDNSIQTHILIKFVGFSIALFTLPLLTYYWTLKNWFSGNGTIYAGIAAAVAANIVLTLYVIVAFLEKDDNSPELEKKQQ